jgi:dienelactone hydrolase
MAGVKLSRKFGWLVASAFALQLSAAAFADASLDETRAAYLKLIDRPRVPLKPELAPLPTVEGLKKFHLWFSSDATERVPGYLLMPDAKKFPGKRPVIIALHGTGGSKDGDEIANLVLRAAKAGFIGVAIDGRFHGERVKPRADGGINAYNEAIARAFTSGQGHPFYYDTTWDVMRLIDYLVTRKDVDATRIGLVGISKGGIETYLTAAADTRVAAAVSYIGVQSFQWELENGQWHARIHTIQDAFDAAAKSAGKSPESVDFVREFYARVVPGIDGQFDGPSMLPLIAPRPLLVVNSDSDANTPIAGVRLAIQAAFPVYNELKASSKLQMMVQENTPHRVNPESIDEGMRWFEVWLR